MSLTDQTTRELQNTRPDHRPSAPWLNYMTTTARTEISELASALVHDSVLRIQAEINMLQAMMRLATSDAAFDPDTLHFGLIDAAYATVIGNRPRAARKVQQRTGVQT
jgi:hypothetical protein